MRKIAVILVMALSAVALRAQQVAVRGIVTDENGVPMPGVCVADKANPSNGVIVDAEGKYQISVAADARLEYTFLSYETVVEDVAGRKTVNVSMKPSAEALEQVVVIGYGTSKKSDLTGAVSVVDAKTVQSAPVSSVGQALQGKVAGAEFMSQNGEPGEAGTVQIRGSRSISAGNSPLIVVDGVMDAVSDLSEINPSDIVSISVLKDVSSTAIYGARGANGVILVTTDNTGSDTDFSVTVKATAGVSRIAGKLDIMDASEYATWRNMVYMAGRNWKEPDPTDPTDKYKLPYPDPSSYGRGTDWIDVLSQTGVYQDYHIRFTGKSKDTRYSLSAGYNDEKGVIIGARNRKFTSQLNIHGDIIKGLRWGLTASFNKQWTDRTSAAVSGLNTNCATMLVPLLTVDDTWNRFGDSETAGGVIFNNPYMSATGSQDKSNRSGLTVTPSLEWSFAKHWKARTQLSYTWSETFRGKYSPSWLPVAASRHSGGTASRSTTGREKVLSETTLTYKRKIKGHSIEVLAGFTAEYNRNSWSSLSGSGYLNDELGYNNMTNVQNPETLVAESWNVYQTKMGVLGRVNWSWRRRYYVTATLRADGASNFAVNNKWGFFPALAFRWSISNEKFLKKAVWLNELSLRLSVGRSGNDAISSYMSLPLLTSAASNWLFGSKTSLAYAPSKLANSNLTWEKTDAVNAGLTFSVLESRISLEVDGYVSRTTDLLLSMRNTATTGFQTYFTNAGSISNAGVEVTLTTKNIKVRNFEWTTDLTVSHNNQTVINAGNGGVAVPLYMNQRNSTQYLYAYKEGYPANALWGYQYEGVWHNEAEIRRNEVTHTYASSAMSSTDSENLGRTRYADVNHDGILDENDYVYLGSADPVLYGGFRNEFKICKNLLIDIYWSWSLGGKIYNLSELYMGVGIASYNKYRYMLNAWSPKNADSNITRPGFNDNLASDHQVHDASWLRLKTVSISYDIPFKRAVRKYIKSLKLGISGENLYLYKVYNGFDPDVNSSSTVYRLDNGSYPRPMKFVFNVQMTF